MPLRDFCHDVVYQILEKYGNPVPTVAGRPIAGGRRQPDGLAARDWVAYHHLVEIQNTGGGNKGIRNCVVCTQSERKPHKRVRSKWMCKECEVALCISECFMEYHYYKEF